MIKIEMRPVWERCECCNDYLCNLHGGHAHECCCPDIDTWVRDVDEIPVAIMIPVITGEEDED